MSYFNADISSRPLSAPGMVKGINAGKQADEGSDLDAWQGHRSRYSLSLKEAIDRGATLCPYPFDFVGFASGRLRGAWVP